MSTCPLVWRITGADDLRRLLGQLGLAGCHLLSLARLTGGWSLSLKNLFGLIPDPLRSRWHGSRDRHLARSMVNIILRQPV